jgi:hypothetical protein
MDLKSLFFLIPDPYRDSDLTFGKLIKNVLLGKILYFFNDELRKLGSCNTENLKKQSRRKVKKKVRKLQTHKI